MTDIKKRLDVLLVETGHAKSRAQAQQLIKNGVVSVDGRLTEKSSAEVEVTAELQVHSTEITRFVSRGGLKLQGALKQTQIHPLGKIVLDIGISTGGFADCLLQNGAAKVVGIDVGHDQLDASLRKDPRVVLFEGVNARDLTANTLGEHAPQNGFELIVVDVSFISLDKILPAIVKFLSPHGTLLALVKPQFEAGPQYLGKTGVIRDAKAFEEVQKKIYKNCEDLELNVEEYFESTVAGTDGNQEYFLRAHHSRSR